MRRKCVSRIRDLSRAMTNALPGALLLALLLGLPACGDNDPQTSKVDQTAKVDPASAGSGDPEQGTTPPASDDPDAGNETPPVGPAKHDAGPAPTDKPKSDTGSKAQTKKSTERWYLQTLRGKKGGHQQVVWAPSTWEGKPTIRDTTTFVSSMVRNMGGYKTTFETTVTYELERAANGDLWWLKVTVEESGRSMIEETTWNGSGYDNVARINNEPPRTKSVAAQAPVKIDAESFLGDLHRAGKLDVGQKYDLPQLNMRAERIESIKLEVVAQEKVEDEHGIAIETMRILQTNPRTKTESVMWLDAVGAFVRIKNEDGTVIQRVKPERARNYKGAPNVLVITTPSRPALERIFSADEHLVEVHLQGDPERKLPDFPDSPWSKIIEKKGSNAAGWVFLAKLQKYDSEAKTAVRPVKDPAFEDDLKPTVLMQTTNPRVEATARQVVKSETDARKAAYLLARYVTKSLSKRSTNVGQASAVQILRDRCGDCSEHCLLFVTLCRAAGIPARRCSGYVNIGGMWGAHAWCEIWTGQWIAADPTTGEIGGGARYLFFGYPDKPDSYPGLVSSRIRDRMRFVSRSITEGEATYNLLDTTKLRRHDKAGGRYLHVLAGLEARDVPSSWTVQMSGNNRMTLQAGPMRATLYASADQGSFYERQQGRQFSNTQHVTFAGAPGILQKRGTSTYVYRLWSRRRRVILSVSGADEDARKMLEKVLAPTFAPTPPKWE